MINDVVAACQENVKVQWCVLIGLALLIGCLTYLKAEYEKNSMMTIEDYIQQEENWIA